MPEYQRIPLDRIDRDDHQVRRTFREEGIEGLAQSLREVGMLHPVLLMPAEGGRYRLISGERRLRAARMAGEPTIPALVLRDSPGNLTQIQLIENLQREDLNPLERALAVQDFMAKEHLSKAAAAAKLGVPRTTLTDWLDVLEVEERFQVALVDNSLGGESPLTLSHVSEAKALAARLGSPHIVSVLLDAVLEYRLSKAETRQVAQIVRHGDDISIQDAIRRVRAGTRGQAVRGSRSQPAGERDVAGLPEMAAAGEDEEGAGKEGDVSGEAEHAGSREGTPYSRVIRALDRFRSVLASLVGGALRFTSPEERAELISYLESLRRWIDDVMVFTRELDDPALAEQRRRQMLEEARRARRRRKKERALRHASTSSAAPLTVPDRVAGS